MDNLLKWSHSLKITKFKGLAKVYLRLSKEDIHATSQKIVGQKAFAIISFQGAE